MGRIFETIGDYVILMWQTFRLPRRWRIFWRDLSREVYAQGVGSMWIVMLVSFFIGAVITIQLGINASSPLVPKFILGYSAREIILLEFSSTIMCMILAGKCGSAIASEIGTMRVTEQIDALEIMGVNSANYIILPKVAGMMLFLPVLEIFSMFIGIMGGYLAAVFTPAVPLKEFVTGVQFLFDESRILYSMIKGEVYVFIIASVSAYCGYTVNGGALEVGRASTNGVVYSTVGILVSDLVLTQMLLV